MVDIFVPLKKGNTYQKKQIYKLSISKVCGNHSNILEVKKNTTPFIKKKNTQATTAEIRNA